MEPGTLKVAKQIRDILKRREETPAAGKDEVLQAIKHKIEQRRLARKRRARLYASFAAAACVAILVTVGVTFRNEKPGSTQTEIARLMETIQVDPNLKEVVLQLANADSVIVGNEDTVDYASDGTVNVNRKLITQAENTAKNEVVYNRLAVPLGKRTTLRLSDGTKIWVNSGTRIVYPAVFQPEIPREIMVEGEIYLDVAHDAGRPFIVKTSKFDVKVLGTSFNVSAYSGEETSSVVLVTGSVHVTDERKTEVKLTPGQMTSVVGGEASKPVGVNVERYVCWKDDLLIVEDFTLLMILEKLHLYYGKEFVSSTEIDTLVTSGKFELKQNFSGIMHTLTNSLPITYREEGNTVYLTYDKKQETH